MIAGAGGAFCAGGDLGSFEELHDARVYRHVSHRLSELMDAIERLEKPVVAAIDGVATGAGLTLALACDWRIASPRARLLFREGRLNLVPTHGGVTRLVKLIGLARAKEALLGGDDLDAEAARRLGLRDASCGRRSPSPRLTHARAMMLRRAPLSFGAAKRLLHLAADSDARSHRCWPRASPRPRCSPADDHREGLAAARDRREPEFTGR